MSKLYNKLAILFLGSLGLTSCIQEEFPECSSLLVSDSDHYVAIKIARHSDDFSTRAEETETEHNMDWTDESKVKDLEESMAASGNYILFFDASNKLLFVSNLNSFDQVEPADKYNGNDVITVFTARIPYSEDLQNNWPKKCLVLLNSDNIYGELNLKKGDDLSTVTSKVWKATGVKPDPLKIGRQGDYFAMTNTVYYDTKENEIHIAETLRDDFQNCLIKSGEAYNPDKVVATIYVERLSAKFTVNFDKKADRDTEAKEADYIYLPENGIMSFFAGMDKDGKPVYSSYPVEIKDTDAGKEIMPKTDGDLFTYKVKITGWGMNAIEKQTKIFKEIDENQLSWNNEGELRYHWSIDPDYSEQGYPWQYRKAYDFAGQLKYYEDLESRSENKLRNYSYDEFIKFNSFDQPFYTPENTYNPAKVGPLDDRTDVLAGTHVLVCAEILNNCESIEQIGEFKARDLYRDRIGNFYESEEECFRAMVMRLNYALQTQSVMKFKYYDWGEEGDNPKRKYKNEAVVIAYPKGHYELCYKGSPILNADGTLSDDFKKKFNSSTSFTEKADILKGDGKIMAWIKDDLSILNREGQPLKMITELKFHENTGLDNPIYLNPEDPDDSINEITQNEIKSLMFEWVGAVDHFNEGKMYYAIPVLHNFGSQTSGEQDYVYDYNHSELGDSGVVRNHWYNFNVVAIKDLGTSVDDINEPIVPNFVNTYNQLTLKVNILGWHLYEATVPVL